MRCYLSFADVRTRESKRRSSIDLAKHYDGHDHFYRAALNIACGTDPARRDAILADFDKHFPEWNDKVADLVWELRPKSVLPRLGKLLVGREADRGAEGAASSISSPPTTTWRPARPCSPCSRPTPRPR